MSNLFSRIAGIMGSTTKAISAPSRGIQLIGGPVRMYDDSKTEYIHKGYMYNDILYSVIKLIVDKAKLAPFGPYIVEDETAYKQLQVVRKQMHIAGNVQKAKELMHKSLKPLPQDRYLTDLFTYPNGEDSMTDLNEQLYGFKLVTGDWFEYWELAEGGLNKNLPISLSALPSNYMGIIASNTLPQYVEEYLMNIGSPIKFTREEILHEKFTNLDWSVPGQQLVGMSPLRAGLRRLQRNNEAQIAGISAFHNGGARGIITPDTDNPQILSKLTWEQVGAIKERINDEIGGGSRASNKTAILNSPYKYTQIGFSPVDLAILESEQFDLRGICNLYNVPSQLLNDPQNKTYNNQLEGEKALTTRCALPLVNSRRESINRKLRSADSRYKNGRTVIDYDQTVYTELEANRKEQAEWIEMSPELTLRMRYELKGLEIPKGISDEVLDTVFLPNSWVPAADMLVQAGDQVKDENTIKNAGLSDY